MRYPSLYNLFIIAITLGVAACGTGSDTLFKGDSSHYDSDMPKIEKQRVGRPYQIGGRWYTPAVHNDYDEIGIASWYGPGFHGRPTANGEKFNENAISAAHTTLPLPSYVEVTNLDNGKQLYVRINDRGPFADDRIIDLSKRAAELLGSKATGLARVRIQLAQPPKNVTLITPDGQKIAGKGYKPSNPQTLIANNPISVPKKNIQIASNQLPLYQYNTAFNTINNNDNFVADNHYDTQSNLSPNNYAVKIGVFSDPNNIMSLEQNLATLGDLQITPVYRQGKMLSEVSLGGYKTQEQALDTINALSQLGINDAVIVNR
jgi:rare lipoprotein A